MNDENKNETVHRTINIDESGELIYWSRRFGVTLEMLREAIKAVWGSVEDVRKHLKDAP